MSVAGKTIVVIPCFNEAGTVASVITEVQKYVQSIVVVDDGSSDATGHVAAAAGAKVLRHVVSQGKGAALKTGWKWAHQQGYEWALCMDGDGQHAAADIPAFFSVSNAPLIIGNRMDDATGMPWVRRAVNRWMSKRISNLAGRHLLDTQCGFRLMNLKAWATLELHTTHFEIESDLLLSFVAAGYPVHFVPVQVIYRDEVSKINPVRDTIRWLRWWRSAKKRFNDNRDAPALTPCDLVPTK